MSKANKIKTAFYTFWQKPWLLTVVMVIIFVIGFAVRIYDLTDPPLDFHPTRQLLNAILTRGIYYQMLPDADPQMREAAISLMNSIEEYEPRIMNGLVALTYLAAGGEYVWIGRIYSILFWTAGGIVLYLLAKRMVSARAALISLGYFYLLPFGILASRSFQVDPFMVMFIIFTAYAFHRWTETPTWIWAVASGLLAGLSILVKVTAVFPVAGLAIGAVLSQLGLRQIFKSPQVWVMAALAVLPGVVYYLVVLSGRAGGYFTFWTLSMIDNLLDPSYYVRWLSFIHRFVDLTIFFLALGGMLIAPRKARPLLLGMWIGYGIYGLFFPFQIPTHDYYHLMLLPILALSLAPLAEIILARLAEQGVAWKAIALAALLFSVIYPAWTARSVLYVSDYRHEPPIWAEIGCALPTDGKVVALTHDYGYRLMYYGWRIPNVLWPTQADLDVSAARDGSQADLQATFEERTAGARYFLITLGGELDNQPVLKDALYNNYAIIAEGDGYVIFDLHQPISP